MGVSFPRWCVFVVFMLTGCESGPKQNAYSGPDSAKVPITSVVFPSDIEQRVFSLRRNNLHPQQTQQFITSIESITVTDIPFFVYSDSTSNEEKEQKKTTLWFDVDLYQNSQSHPYTKQSVQCDSNGVESCQGLSSYQLSCDKISSIAVLNFRITSVSDDAVIMNRDFRVRSEEDTCKQKRAVGGRSPGELLDPLFRQVAVELQLLVDIASSQ
ncbi:hypothetical protein CS022_14745 [Veronia nyctiphanis]|uniref:ABC-type transport auxiliary lipoprotein component domain-containing protein n=1 Tax=Veronia nyctiphanis TaxID=1278244 RepID=A0A4Q0YNN8_9GAMM|nr:hypothetical protein [Veronia nyctiphanis]RXJ72567.1 hypothetical protein CS022_14745 [Veronia nyctiphanis]